MDMYLYHSTIISANRTHIKNGKILINFDFVVLSVIYGLLCLLPDLNGWEQSFITVRRNSCNLKRLSSKTSGDYGLKRIYVHTCAPKLDAVM